MAISLNKSGANKVSEVHFTPFREIISDDLRVLNFLKRLRCLSWGGLDEGEWIFMKTASIRRIYKRGFQRIEIQMSADWKICN